MQQFSVKPKSSCPCGSGRSYRKCHAHRKRGENFWRGPGHEQNIYFGDIEKFRGGRFQTHSPLQGELVLLGEGGNIVPMCKWQSVPVVASPRTLQVEQLELSEDGGWLNVAMVARTNGDDSGASIPILVQLLGTATPELHTSSANGQAYPTEFGKWILFYGLDSDPVTALKRVPQWFRYLGGTGYRIEIPVNQSLELRGRVRHSGSALIRLCCLSELSELVCLELYLNSTSCDVSVQVSREQVFWDLILSPELFPFSSKNRRSIKVFDADVLAKNFILRDFRKGTRLPVAGPCAMDIELKSPQSTALMNRFADVIENVLHADANSDTLQLRNTQSLREATFRDYVLGVVRAMGTFAYAEPTQRGGFVDLLIRDDSAECIAEFKIWGRKNYKAVTTQVLQYGTGWTSEYVVVMVNPNAESVLKKHEEFVRQAPGFVRLRSEPAHAQPIEKLYSFHRLGPSRTPVIVAHLLLNLPRMVPLVGSA